MAHVVSRFPCVTETFVQADIRCTKAVWSRTVILAFSRGMGPIPTWVDQVLFATPGRLYAWSQLHYLRTQPAEYFRLLGLLIAGHRRDLPELFKVLFIWPAIVHMAYIAERSGVDAVHAHWASIPATAALVITKLLDKAFLFNAHAYDIYLRRSFLGEKLARSKLCITCTESNRRHLLKSYPALRPDKIAVCYHGVDTMRFRPGPAPAAPPFVVLTVGRATWQKGFPTLLKAVARCARLGVDIRLMMLAMPGPLSGLMRAQVHELGIAARVVWVPPRKAEDMPALYQSAHAFALACEVGPFGERDGIPNVLAEAMACGLPVIATPIGGIEEVVKHQVTGLLVAPGEPDALAEQLRRLAESPELRGRLGSSARDWIAQSFSRQRCQEELVSSMRQAYEDLETPMNPIYPIASECGSSGSPSDLVSAAR